jgi:hypothetical protein
VIWAKILDTVGIKQKKSLDLERGMWHHGMKAVSCVSGLDGTPPSPHILPTPRTENKKI